LFSLVFVLYAQLEERALASKEDGGRDGDANTKDDEKCEETEKMNRDVAEICLGAEAAAIMTGRVFFLLRNPQMYLCYQCNDSKVRCFARTFPFCR